MRARWFAPLLNSNRGATMLIHDLFPEAKFHLEKRQITSTKMLRHVRFDFDGQVVMRAHSEVDLRQTKPEIVRLLTKTKKPLGEIVTNYNVKRTRLKVTTRTRAFHYYGDIHARIWERFYVMRP